MTPTKDSAGNRIYVTRTGQYAVSTKTVPFHEGRLRSSATKHHPATVTKIVTETVTFHAALQSKLRTYKHWHSGDELFMKTERVADLGYTTVPITKSVQLLDNGTMPIVPPRAQATLVPLIWDPKYLVGWEHLLALSMPSCRDIFPHADWDSVPRIAYHLRQHNGQLEPELSLKYALIMALRGHDSPEYHFYDQYPSITSPHRHMVTKTMGSVCGGGQFEMTQPTQTHHDHVFVADPLNKYRAYDPRHHAVAPTGSCHGHHRNKTECKVEQCMWNKFMRPINITTVMPMAMYDCSGLKAMDYFTHTTELHYPHWGASKSRGIYYPTRRKFATASNGSPTCKMVRATPDPSHMDAVAAAGGFFSRFNKDNKVHGDPVCHDADSCHGVCDKYVKDPPFDPKLLWWIIPSIAGSSLLFMTCCCCLLWRRRRKGDPKDPRKQSIGEKIRRMSTKGPETVVVNQVTGTATDPATSQSVSPGAALTTAIVAGAASGTAAAAVEKAEHGSGGGAGDGKGQGEGHGGSGAGDGKGKGDGNAAESNAADDGKGTTGRRAEEGRGRVNFANGDNGNPTTETHAAPAEHTETTPAPAPHDGAFDGSPYGVGSGRQMPDVGSMRGRKRQRAGPLGLNLGPW